MAVAYNPKVVTDNLVLCFDPLNKKSYREDNNIIDASTWIAGTTGGQTGFGANGDAAENSLILGTDPFGNTATLWEAVPDATSGGDGGWNTSYFPVDHTKKYRYSVWVNRTVLGSNGRFYLGLNAFNNSNSNVGIFIRSSGNNTTNPYFEVSSSPPASSELPVGEWVLVVGHVFPSGSGVGSNDPESAIYKVDGTKLSAPITDYVWNTNTTKSLHRSYLFYCTDTTVRQRWAYPRVDLCDGTEPSIRDLLDNKVNSLYLYGLANTKNSTLINGPTYNSGGFYFDGVDDYLRVDYTPSTMDFSLAQTICMWIKPDVGSNTARRNPYNQAYGGSGTLTYELNSSITYFFGTSGVNGNPYVGRSSGFTVNEEELAFISVTRDQNTDTVNWYKNGVLQSTATAGGYASTNNGTEPILIGDGYVSPFLGNIYDCKVYNRALTADEIKQNYNATKGRFQ